MNFYFNHSNNNCFLGNSSKSDFPFFKVGGTGGIDFLLLLGLFDLLPAVGDLGDLVRGDLGDCFPSLDVSAVFSESCCFSSAAAAAAALSSASFSSSSAFFN